MKCHDLFVTSRDSLRSDAVFRCGKYIYIPCVLSSRPTGQLCSWILQNFVVLSFIKISQCFNLFASSTEVS